MEWDQVFVLDVVDHSAVGVMKKRLSGLQKKDRNLSTEIERLKKRIQPIQR